MPINVQKKILDELVDRYKGNPNVRAIFIGGSLARGDANRYSDVDLFVVVKKPVGYLRYDHKGLFIEVDSFSLAGLGKRLKNNPTSVYQLGELKALHDPEKLLPRILRRAESFKRGYRVTDLAKADSYIKLRSLRNKLSASLENEDAFSIMHFSSIGLSDVISGLFLSEGLLAPPISHVWRHLESLDRVPPEALSVRRRLADPRPALLGKSLVRLINVILPGLEPSMGKFGAYYRPWN